jgi:hypothetical protein
MSVNIGRFVTRCKAPRQAGISSDLLERVVRQDFARESVRQLRSRPNLPFQIIRINRLLVRLTLPAGKLDQEILARAWAAAFVRELLNSITSRESNSAIGIVLMETRTDWLVKVISELLSGPISLRWEYEEFGHVLDLPTAEAIVAIFRSEPSEIVPVLLSFEKQNRLHLLLARLGELELDQLFTVIADFIGESGAALEIVDLLEIADLAKTHGVARTSFANRREALRLFLKLSLLGKRHDSSSWTPRIVLHSLMALEALVELTQSSSPANWVEDLTPEALAQHRSHGFGPVVDVLAKIRVVALQRKQNGEALTLESLAQLVSDISPIPKLSTPGSESKTQWIASNCAGLLLLIGLLNRLQWPQRILYLSLASRYGPRLITYFLTALAIRILGDPLDTDRIDPAVALLAGWTDPPVADLTGLQKFLFGASDAERMELLRHFTENDNDFKPVEASWDHVFDSLATILLREFAARIRGFRQASPSSIVKSFFRQSGRICIDDKKLLVILESNPFHIALHISSMDESVESVSWLAGRRVEFQLAGL